MVRLMSRRELKPLPMRKKVFKISEAQSNHPPLKKGCTGEQMFSTHPNSTENE